MKGRKSLFIFPPLLLAAGKESGCLPSFGRFYSTQSANSNLTNPRNLTQCGIELIVVWWISSFDQKNGTYHKIRRENAAKRSICLPRAKARPQDLDPWRPARPERGPPGTSRGDDRHRRTRRGPEPNPNRTEGYGARALSRNFPLRWRGRQRSRRRRTPATTSGLFLSTE